MTSSALLMLVGTLCLVFITGFLCVALFYCISILRKIKKTWNVIEQSTDGLIDSLSELHSRFMGLRTSVDVIATGFKTVLALYQRKISVSECEDNEEDEESDKKTIQKRKKGKR